MTWKILITDGFEESGIQSLRDHQFEVDVQKVNAELLPSLLPNYQGIIVRSATKVRASLIQKCPELKFIARAGVGLDNIDVEAARSLGIAVLNTPASSSRSVAELAMSHMMSLTRGLQLSNRTLDGPDRFTSLKKSLSASNELKDKTLLLIGMGRIGRELAKMALGLEMKVLATDPFLDKVQVGLQIQNVLITIPIPLVRLEEGIPQADYISIHSPYTGKEIIDRSVFNLVKKTCIIVNTSRGENIDEQALLEALDQGLVAGAGLDVFHNEPNVRKELLNHPKVSVTPHIGASTFEAQQRIADELVAKIVDLKNSIN